jgi:1-acyl-sn-glycerol-3-phosphate acyltransferase
MRKALAKLVLDILGWKLEGMDQLFVPKCIIAVAPHTSQWDVVLLVFIRAAIGLRSHFIVKKEAFFFPLGQILRVLGAVEVDRSGGKNTVEAVTEVFKKRKEFRMTIAPEGTRKFTNTFKTGFYYIALNARIPIFLLGMDYDKKLAVVGDPFYPTGELEKDMAAIRSYFLPFKGLHPERGLR